MIIKDVLHGMLNIFCPLYFFATISVKKNKFYLIRNSSEDVFRILNSWQIPDITNLTKIYKRCIAIYRKIIQWKKYFVTSYRMHALWCTYLKNRNLCLTLWHVHLIPLLVGHWNLRNLVTSTCVNLQEGIYGKMWVANAFYTPTYCLFCILWHYLKSRCYFSQKKSLYRK